MFWNARTQNYSGERKMLPREKIGTDQPAPYLDERQISVVTGV